MLRWVYAWLREADQAGRLHHRWRWSGELIGRRVVREAERRGWIAGAGFGIAQHITAAGRDALATAN